jgi:hypothetical protein
MKQRRTKLSTKDFRRRDDDYLQGRPTDIFFEYKKNNINRDDAIKALSRLDESGKLYAGQLLMEKSFDAASNDESIELLSLAAEQFIEIDKMAAMYHEEKKLTAITYKAKLFLGYLPTYAFMTSEGTLPPFRQAQDVYQKTVQIGAEVLDQMKKPACNQRELKRRTDLVGLLGEVAVLGLINRSAVYDIGSEDYFAIPTTVGFDRVNNHGTTIDNSSDINIYTDIPDIYSPTYRLAIKSSDFEFEGKKKLEQGCSIRIEVTPDLEIYSGEQYVANRITEELFSEMSGIRYSGDITNSLNARAEKMFDIIDER